MITLVKPRDYKTSQWSGGTTTELFIFPPDGSYKDNNFQFRISCATVADSPSVFTKLEGVSRILCLLDGELTLDIDGLEYPLTPYDVCAFDGGLDTVGKGIASDFNLMCRNCEGALQVLFAARPVKVKTNRKHQFFFSREQDFSITVDGNEYLLNQGELLYLYDEKEMIHVRPVREGKNPIIHITCEVQA